MHRYVQEFLTHSYPSVANYVKVPLEEIILIVRGRTRGFTATPPSVSTSEGRRGGKKYSPLSPPAAEKNASEKQIQKKSKTSTSEKVRGAVSRFEKSQNLFQNSNVTMFSNLVSLKSR